MDANWPSQNADPFLLQANSNDPFTLDMNTLFGFDDALFQEQNCAAPTTYQTQNLANSTYTAMPSTRQSDLSPITDVDSPNSLPSTFDLDSMTPPVLSSQGNSPMNDWLLNPTTGEVTLSSESTDKDATKRSRGDVDDSISACWKSHLCPNRKEDLSRPDSCRGECAEFLFASPSELPEDKKILSDILAKSEPKVVLETSSSNRQLKRNEMESTPDTEGRTVSSTPAVSIETEEKSYKATSSSKRPSPTSPKQSYQTSPASPSTASPVSLAQKQPKGRVPHNQVEKKYRENVNAQLEALKRVVPVSKQQLVGFDGLDIEDLAINSRQPSKAVVLSSATAYIKQLEKENKRLQEELMAMKTQNKTLQSLVKCDDCSLMNYARQWKIRAPV